MNAERKRRAREIFADALEKDDPQERTAFVVNACGTDAELRQLVEALLKAHEGGGDLPGQTLLAAPDPVIGERPGTIIGRYKLLEKIGEGGFGVVYMAEQKEPVHRKVALKIVKAGMDTKEVITRFEAERQALALMDHPNIAQVFDGGVTQAGRPYFVMELVRGISITDFCDQRDLSTDERLQLFVQVSHAVQHAHQKGIIHRDLKPSNILVTLLNGEPLPKIIDFGVAKALGQQLTDKTLFTGFLRMVGTPAYMSPEQADLSGVDIDTRADIYALGVLLYELLTGVTPYDKETLARAAFDEIRRMICETEPPKPSARLVGLGNKLTEVAHHRHIEPAELTRQVHGDLDWIVMKALEKDRRRRYETANALADDIQRHMEHQPVQARPPSAAYRAEKYVRRHRMGVALAASVTVALIVGLILAFIGFLEAKRERDRALTAEAQAEKHRQQAETEREKAQTEATRSAQVAQFLEDMLKNVDPRVALGQDTTLLRRIMDQTAERVSKDLKDQPEVEAELRSTLGYTYYRLDEYRKAETMQREALRLRQSLHGATNLLVADSLYDLGRTLIERRDFAEAESLLREALATRRSSLGNEHPDIARSLAGLAEVQTHQSRPEEAEAMLREALAMQRKLLPAPHPDIIDSLIAFGSVLGVQGKFDESNLVKREALEMSRALWGPDNPPAATLLRRIGGDLRKQGRLEEAEASMREALAMSRRMLGNGNIFVAISLLRLADLLRNQGKYAEAENLIREAMSIREKVNREDWEFFQTQSLLGNILLDRGKPDEALPFLLSGYEGLKRQWEKAVVGAGSAALLGLVRFHETNGWSNTGATWLRGEIEQCRQAAERGDPSALDILNRLGGVLRDNGRLADAGMVYREILARWGEGAEQKPPSVAAVLGQIQGRLGLWDDAVKQYQILIEAEPENHWLQYQAHAAALAAGQVDVARELSQGMLSRFADTQEPAICERVARSVLLSPGESSDLDRAVELAERAFKTNSTSPSWLQPWVQCAKGMAEYRLGHHAIAAELLESPHNNPDPKVACLAGYFLAMSLQQQGDTNAAQGVLKETNDRFTEVLRAGDLGDLWHDHCRNLVARTEAERLILGQETSPPVTVPRAK